MCHDAQAAVMVVNSTGGFVRQKGLNGICEKSMLTISLTPRSFSQSSLQILQKPC